jgi:hypothetical protein
VFWIDIESLMTTVLLLVFHIVVIIRTESLYTEDKYSARILDQNSLSTTPRDLTTIETKPDRFNLEK